MVAICAERAGLPSTMVVVRKILPMMEEKIVAPMLRRMS
jgi:hypothetical protein